MTSVAWFGQTIIELYFLLQQAASARTTGSMDREAAGVAACVARNPGDGRSEDEASAFRQFGAERANRDAEAKWEEVRGKDAAPESPSAPVASVPVSARVEQRVQVRAAVAARAAVASEGLAARWQYASPSSRGQAKSDREQRNIGVHLAAPLARAYALVL
jgi:hypothetical protein